MKFKINEIVLVNPSGGNDPPYKAKLTKYYENKFYINDIWEATIIDSGVAFYVAQSVLSRINPKKNHLPDWM